MKKMRISSTQCKDLEEMWMFIDKLDLWDNFEFRFIMKKENPFMEIIDHYKNRIYILTCEEL